MEAGGMACKASSRGPTNCKSTGLIKGRQERAGKHQPQDQTSEKPGRGDPEVTSDLMTPAPTHTPTRPTSEEPGSSAWVMGVGAGNGLRGHL